ncbi:MAG TPA: NADPH-dependent FMN reductase [Solirubrobacteraceae bacterium]|nr:NADPH-dependent FMN reductase [Solirubrobacteraceae bacterium]
MRVLAISGSLRRGSHNTALLRAAAGLAPAGVELELYDGLGSLPPYNEDDDIEPAPPAVAALRDAISAADAVLISTPEYNGTIPGQLKQVVDWASRPYGSGSSLFGKPVAVIGASVTDYGAVWAQDHLRKALGIAGARVVGSELPLAGAHAKFDSAGRLTDEQSVRQLRQVLGDLVGQHEELAQAA